jgi:hypothetical protein
VPRRSWNNALESHLIRDSLSKYLDRLLLSKKDVPHWEITIAAVLDMLKVRLGTKGMASGNE